MPTLTENLIEGIISNIVARLKASFSYNKELVGVLVTISEAAFVTFAGVYIRLYYYIALHSVIYCVGKSTVLAVLMTQIWTFVGGLANRWQHASSVLLHSLLRCTDGRVMQLPHGTCIHIYEYLIIL